MVLTSGGADDRADATGVGVGGGRRPRQPLIGGAGAGGGDPTWGTPPEPPFFKAYVACAYSENRARCGRCGVHAGRVVARQQERRSERSRVYHHQCSSDFRPRKKKTCYSLAPTSL